MNKSFLAASVFGLAVAISVQAQTETAGKAIPKVDQAPLRASTIAKYDLNKDGVLDKNETKRLSKEDKKLLARTGGVGTARKETEKHRSAEASTKPEPKPETKTTTKPESKPEAKQQPPTPPTQPAPDENKPERGTRGKGAK